MAIANKTMPIQVRLTDAQYAWVMSQAASEFASISEVIRYAVQVALELDQEINRLRAEVIAAKAQAEA